MDLMGQGEREERGGREGEREGEMDRRVGGREGGREGGEGEKARKGEQTNACR